MISVLVSVLAVAAVAGSGAQPSRPAAASGLIGTGQMTVRAKVVDRCTVGPGGAVCQGGATVRPLPVDQPTTVRVDIVF
ncbi:MULTISPECIES: hypothetical protein [unclassified Caulobacter]|uniref:hypothetical protein n=1 Tax=unclassified Caulobacter TaxID=2648921 RepID=UPI0004A75250|nr:hypothetical protein [Caulobacter sp. UNC358MFTsu5.1]